MPAAMAPLMLLLPLFASATFTYAAKDAICYLIDAIFSLTPLTCRAARFRHTQLHHGCHAADMLLILIFCFSFKKRYAAAIIYNRLRQSAI